MTRLRTRLHVLRQLRRSEAGVTLVELMFSTALLSLVLATAFTTVSVMENQARITTNRFTATGEAQTIAARIAKDLRAAVRTSALGAPFVSADAHDVVFYADLGAPNGPTKIHAYLTTLPGYNVKLFNEDIQQADAGGSLGNYTYTLNPTVNRINGKYIDSSQPMFQYFTAAEAGKPNGTPLPVPITSTAVLKSIDVVQISIRVRVSPTSPTVVIQSRVHVRNVDYNPNN
jgi:type II secretory pathway component PulJ